MVVPASNTSAMYSDEFNSDFIVWVSRAADKFFNSHLKPSNALIINALLDSDFEATKFIEVLMGRLELLSDTFFKTFYKQI